MDYILLIVGLALLTVGADMLTKGCVGMAARFRVPEFIVGLTVMAVGTSMPELTVSTLSAINGNSDMAIGNVTGSNIFNILIILGICAMVRPMVFTRENIRRDIPICIAVSALLLVMALYIGSPEGIGRLEGIILFLLYIAFVLYSIRSAKQDAPDMEAGTDDGTQTEATMGWGKVILFIAIGLSGLIYGGNLCLNSATAIARAWGVSEAIIAITIVAAGTSLPELASSVAATASGKLSLALGNIIGSNVANILLILGMCGTIKPLTMGGITPIDMWMVVGAAVVLLLSALAIGRRRITRAEGLMYLAIYVGYVVLLMK
ncbi:MAG: calcium/sodium antiporter [Alistipes sp.]|nr:calcium/sodium antiporter [Alistipes sp.]MBQ5617565.1 calcium/sodium antiporter [Alistipes sp.]MBQ5922389.1 calcium/sodium antiporter [Alistipes sp.]